MAQRQDPNGAVQRAGAPEAAVSLPIAALRSQWFTAQELAEIVLARRMEGWPTTANGIKRIVRREGWDAMGAAVARPRPTEGRAVMEYHVSLLPKALQLAIVGLAATATAVATVQKDAEADRRRMAAIRTQGLSARTRQTMEARASILLAIEGYAASRGALLIAPSHGPKRRPLGRPYGIKAFLAAIDAWETRQDIERRVKAGQVLTATEAARLARPPVLTAEDGFHLSPDTLRTANARGAGGSIRIGRTTLYQWFAARDEGGVAALAPAPTKGAQPLAPGFEVFLKHYARPSKPTITDALKSYHADPANPRLTEDQVGYGLRVKLNNIERHVGREGILTLRSRLAYVTRTTEDMWPTTVYTGDGKTFDAEIADPVTRRPIRPEITTILDVVTRKAVGVSLARSENQRSVAEALRRACIDNGIPAIFYVDRGPGFRNDALDADVAGLMGRLGITKMHAAPYGAQAKGRIERPQATIWDVLAKRLPTYIGEDMDREAGHKVHKVTRAQIKEFGQSRLLPTWDDFVSMVAARIAEYNAAPHRGLPKFEDPETGRIRHMSPDEAWAAHVAAGFEPVPVDPDEADDLFRPYVIRTAARALVHWNDNAYFHEALQPWHGQKVMVGYDYHQADRVWVRQFDVSSGQPGPLICVARFGGNEKRYVPRTFEAAAIETRANGRLRRIDAKRDAIEAERDGLMIEAEAAVPATFLDPVPDAPDFVSAEIVAPDFKRRERRRVFASDEDLAAWALENPGALSPNQISVLRDCMSRAEAREHFRLSGIDVEALRTLLRAGA